MLVFTRADGYGFPVDTEPVRYNGGARGSRESQCSIGENISHNGPVAYVEAEFFGGDGTQASIVWHETRIVQKLIVQTDAINIALQKLGVKKGAEIDEFSAIHLGLFRDTEEWIEEDAQQGDGRHAG